MRLEEYAEPVSEDVSSGSMRLRLAFKTAVRLAALVQRRTAASAEAAGLLFGSATDGEFISVVAFRSFALELPYDRRIPLQQFQEAAAATLAASRFDPEVASLQPVGWYRLHLEQVSDLSEAEMQLHNHILPGQPFAALLLQPGGPGQLSGLVFSSSAVYRPLTPVSQRSGSLNVSTESVGIESVEVTLHGTIAWNDRSATKFSYASFWSWLTAHGPAFRQTLNGYVWGMALVTAVVGFLIGATLSQDGQFTASNRASVSKSQTASALSKASAFELSLKREGRNILITWNGGLVRPTLAYLSVAAGHGTENLNLTPNYRPNGMLLLPGQQGAVDVSLSLSDGLDTVERRASLPSGENPVAELAIQKEVPDKPRQVARTSDELSRLETRNRRLEALITVLEQRKDEKTHHNSEDTLPK